MRLKAFCRMRKRPRGVFSAGNQVAESVCAGLRNLKETKTMVRLLILYGHPEDPEAFDAYYEKTHIPLAKRMRGLKKWTIGRALGSPGDEPSPYYYIADLYAESREAIEAVLKTPEGQAAVEDVPNYASGGVTFIYTEIEDVIP